MKYPAIHNAASASSDSAQRTFLLLVVAEYVLLAAIAVGYAILPDVRESHVALLVCVTAALAVFWYRASKKPDEDWYQFRALAESTKTLTWRFAMRAEPFDGDEALARATLRNKLKELLHLNQSLGATLEPHAADQDQISEAMLEARGSPLDRRRELYQVDRISDQRTWYARKAGINKQNGKRWFVAVTCLYIIILLILGLRIAYPDQDWLSPDPLLVIAASIVGWMQVKKYNDLAAAYFITAQEISIVATGSMDVTTDSQFSDFVNSAELVFSREHTQWIARRRT